MKMKLEGINMQRYILSKKNSITLISAILIALAFFGRFSLDNMCVMQNRSAEVCNGNVHNSALLFLKRKRTCQQS